MFAGRHTVIVTALGSGRRAFWAEQNLFARSCVAESAVFYYFVLFAACLVAGLVVVWLCKEASTIGKKAKNPRGHVMKAKPTDHLDGVPVNTSINDAVMSWGGKGGLAPKHPARSHAAKPPNSKYWDSPSDRRQAENLHAQPDGSKSKSEFWSYLVAPDRPGHGTGVNPGHGTGVQRGQRAR